MKLPPLELKPLAEAIANVTEGAHSRDDLKLTLRAARQTALRLGTEEDRVAQGLPTDAEVLEAAVGVISGWASQEQIGVVFDHILRRNYRLLTDERNNRIAAGVRAAATASQQGEPNGQH